MTTAAKVFGLDNRPAFREHKAGKKLVVTSQDGKKQTACTVRDASILTGVAPRVIRDIVQGVARSPFRKGFRFEYLVPKEGVKEKKVDFNLDIDLLNRYYRALLSRGFSKIFAKRQIIEAIEKTMTEMIERFEITERTEQELLELEKEIEKV
jgi:hypothetical protein